MKTKFLPKLSVPRHHFLKTREGRVVSCGRCPLPEANRVHDFDDQAAQLAEYDARRLGEGPD